MKVFMQDVGDFGSKKKSTLRSSSLQPNYFSNEQTNSKKSITWGGIHTRVFNEQENRNWDTSPQNLRSDSDKSRSIDVSNLVDEKIYEQTSNEQQEAYQNFEQSRQQNSKFQTQINNNYQGHNQQQQQYDQDQQIKQFQRLSVHFQYHNEGQIGDDSYLLPNQQISQNYQKNALMRENQDQNIITAETKNKSYFQNNQNYVDQMNKFQQQNNLYFVEKNQVIPDQKNNQENQSFNDDSQSYHDSSESNLLDNIGMSRLSGFMNDSNDTSKQLDPKSEILLSIRDIQSQYPSQFQNEQKVQNNNNAFENNNIKSKEILYFAQDTNQDGKLQNNGDKSIKEGYFNKQYPLNLNTNAIKNENNNQNQQSIINQHQLKNENIQNVIFNNNNNINQNLFKNFHEVEKQQNNMMIINQPNLNQESKNLSNMNQSSRQEKQIKNVNRLSELYDEYSLTEQQQIQNNKLDSKNKKQQIINSKQEVENQNSEILNKKLQNQKGQSELYRKDQILFDENFSQKNNDQLDSSKRIYPFSIGYISDSFNQSKTQGNESQSYILELDVNSLSDPNFQYVGVNNRNNNSYTPSNLVNDLKDLEDGNSFNTHINSYVKITKEKKAREKQELDGVKQCNLFSDEDENDQIVNQNQANQKMVPEKNYGLIQKQKVQFKQQLNELIKNNNNSNISPKKHSISKQILPNSSIQKEMKRLSELPYQNNLKGILSNVKTSQSGNNSKDKQYFKNKGILQNKQNQGDSKSKSDWNIKSTPLRKSNRFVDEYDIDNDDENDNLNELNQGVQELENLVVRMPLTSYEKNVLLKVLTPGKQIKNLQQIRESFVFNNQNKKNDEQDEENSEDQFSIDKDETRMQQMNSEVNSEEVVEKLSKFFQEKINKTEKDLEEQQKRLKELEEFKRKNQEEIEKEEQELQQLEDKLKQKRQNRGQQPQTDEEKENQNPQIMKKNSRYILYENQYWQAYQIIINYFGFEYVGKVKDKNQKGDMVAFKFLNRFLCSLQLAKQKQQNQDSPSLILYKGVIQSIVNSSETQLFKINSNDEKQFNSYTELLSSPNIAKITSDLLHKNYKNYTTHQQNLIEILQYIGSKLIELEELYRQLKHISSVYTLSNFSYNLTTFDICFNLKLTQFPQKLVKFILSPEQWFNEIQIQIINNSQLSPDDIHSKLNEDIDNAINTLFNSKINSQASYSKLKLIIEAINIKNGIDQPNSERNSTARNTPIMQQTPQSRE